MTLGQTIKSFSILLAHADQMERPLSKRPQEEAELRQLIADSLNYDGATAEEFVCVREKMFRVQEGIGEWSREHPDQVALGFPEDIAIYARWAPEVGRYSFHWNLE